MTQNFLLPDKKSRCDGSAWICEFIHVHAFVIVRGDTDTKSCEHLQLISDKATKTQWCRHITYTDGDNLEIEKRQTMRVNWGDWENGKTVREDEANTKHKNQRRDKQWGCQPWGLCNGVLSLCCAEAVIMACWLWLSPSSASPVPPQEGLNVVLQPFPRLSEPQHARCPSEEVFSN